MASGEYWAGRVDGAGGVVVTGGGSRPVGAPEMRSSGADGRASCPVAIGDDAAAVVVVRGSGGGGGGEDMVETRVPDTKLVGLGFLPALLRRLYGQNSGGRGRARELRRVGAVAKEEKAAAIRAGGG